MNRHSIFTKLNIFFGIFLILLSIVFFGAFIMQKHQLDGDFMRRAFQCRMMLENSIGTDTQNIIRKYELRLMGDDEIGRIVASTKPDDFVPPPPPPPPMDDSLEHIQYKEPMFDDRKHPHGKERVYGKFNKRYIVLETPDGVLGFEDMASPALFYISFALLFVLLFGGTVILYLMILANLKPLKKLENEIVEFGNNGTPKIWSLGEPKGEIEAIQKVFYETSCKTASLTRAREVFLKNAAHELKTPIAKGLVVAHMVYDKTQHDRLIAIFSRLNAIVENIKTAEEMQVNGFEPSVEEIDLRKLCDKIIQEMMFEYSCVDVQIDSNTIVYADERLLYIAVANLLDNGIKFADDGVVTCFIDNDRIVIKNKSEALYGNFDSYLEPFFKETSQRNASGMGLGLYLANQALEIQGMKLGYEHKDSYNYFYIYLKSR